MTTAVVSTARNLRHRLDYFLLICRAYLLNANLQLEPLPLLRDLKGRKGQVLKHISNCFPSQLEFQYIPFLFACQFEFKGRKAIRAYPENFESTCCNYSAQ